MAKHRSKLIAALGFLLNSYGLILSILLLLWLLTGESLFFVNLFINISPAIFYALPFALFLAVLLKSRRSLLFLLIPTISFLTWYAPHFFPRQIESATGQEITLLTYNLQAGNHSFEQVDAVVRDAHADIVGLEEVNRDMAAYLEGEWAEEYPYHIAYTNPYDEAQYSGRFFMSRYPINHYEFMVSSLINRLLYIRIELNIAGQTVVVYSVHLPPPRYTPLFDTSLRNGSMTALLKAASADDSPVILMGDFNMTDQSNDYRRISSQYQDSFLTTSVGLGTTWPNAQFANPNLGFMPAMIRIDYIFLSAEFMPEETRVLREGVSDHFPLWARIILRD